MTETNAAPPEVAAGTATDAQLAQWLGVDLMNRLGAQWRGEEGTKRAFNTWHKDVTAKLGVSEAEAFALFTGQTSVEDFAANVDESLLDGIIEHFPTLCQEHRMRMARRAQMRAEAMEG